MSRIMDWIARSNARSDERLAASSTNLLVARAVFGAVITVKGGALFVNGSHAWQYALAPLLIAGGLMLTFESCKLVVARLRARKRI